MENLQGGLGIEPKESLPEQNILEYISEWTETIKEGIEELSPLAEDIINLHTEIEEQEESIPEENAEEGSEKKEQPGKERMFDLVNLFTETFERVYDDSSEKYPLDLEVFKKENPDNRKIGEMIRKVDRVSKILTSLKGRNDFIRVIVFSRYAGNVLEIFRELISLAESSNGN